MDSNQPVVVNGVNFMDFWNTMWPIVLGLAVLLVVALVLIVRKRMKYKVENADVSVLSVRAVTAANPTMAMARNVPLASAATWMVVTFAMNNGDGQIELRVPDGDSEKMSKGMRGRLRYRKDEFLSFVPQKK